MPDPDIVPTPAAPPRPDALKVPKDYRLPAATRGKRFHALFDLAERVLGADAARGEKAHRWSLAREGVFLYSLDPTSTLLFPTTHHLEGRRRYTWVPQPDGLIFGYLTDEAKADRAAS